MGGGEVVQRGAIPTAPSPRALNPEVPESLSAVILRALAKRPEHRWPSAADLLQALERVQA